MMYRLWWVDVETTGLDPLRDEIIEIAMFLTECDPQRKWLSPVSQLYTGLQEPSCPISPEASRVNGLTLEHLQGKRLDMELLKKIVHEADGFVAHNASFDKGFVEMILPEVRNKMWFCSIAGIEWKKWGFASAGLQSLLRAHHIFPSKAHRAESDIQSLYLLLQEHNPLDKSYFWEMWDNSYHRFLSKQKPPAFAGGSGEKSF